MILENDLIKHKKMFAPCLKQIKRQYFIIFKSDEIFCYRYYLSERCKELPHLPPIVRWNLITLTPDTYTMTGTNFLHYGNIFSAFSHIRRRKFPTDSKQAGIIEKKFYKEQICAL